MLEYPKIETLFNRNKETFKVIESELRNPVYSIIKTWQWTEKIDGTNIRVMLSKDTGKISFSGRTDNSNVPSKLLQVLIDTFTQEKMKATFWREGEEPVDAIVFGEGYGAGIQKGGGNYNPNPAIRIFDVLIDNKWWLNWENTVDVVNKLGVKTVSVISKSTLAEAISIVKVGFISQVAIEEGNPDTKAEGLVGRTIEPLFDKRGHRLIIKIKTKDF